MYTTHGGAYHDRLRSRVRETAIRSFRWTELPLMVAMPLLAWKASTKHRHLLSPRPGRPPHLP